MNKYKVEIIYISQEKWGRLSNCSKTRIISDKNLKIIVLTLPSQQQGIGLTLGQRFSMVDVGLAGDVGPLPFWLWAQRWHTIIGPTLHADQLPMQNQPLPTNSRCWASVGYWSEICNPIRTSLHDILNS